MSFLDFRVSQISNANPKYKYNRSFSFCSLNTWLTNVLFPWFQTSARIWHCLYAYHSLGDNVCGLSKLVPYGSILILCSFFSCAFLVVCVPMEWVLHLGKKSLFSEIKVSTQLSFSTDIYVERTFINLLRSWHVSSKSCRNVNSVMIVVFAVRCV